MFAPSSRVIAGEILLTGTEMFGVNGSVEDIIVDGDIVYLGGQFTGVGTPVGHFVVADTGASEIDASFPSVLSNEVRVLITDGDGGWFVGGSFETVGGEAIPNLAHILSDGTVDTDFVPAPDSDVVALARSDDGSTLYAGGSFTDVNSGTARNYLAAFDTSTGTATSFNPDPDDEVYSLALSPGQSTLYLGGTFLNVGGAARSYLAAVGVGDSLASVSFAPEPDDTVDVIAVSSDGASVFAGGNFTDVNGGTTRNYLASFNSADGVATAFDPDMDGAVYDLILSPGDTTLYAGGDFTSVNGGTTRNRMAAFDASSGAVSVSFDSDLDSSVYDIDLSDDGSIIYAVGDFTTVNGGSEDRQGCAAFDTADGSVTSFDLRLDAGPDSVALSGTDNVAIAGGSVNLAGMVSRNNLAAIDVSTGTLTSFDPDVDSGGFIDALALNSDGTTLYVGGLFSTVNGSTSRNNLLALDTTTGTATAFDPNLSNIVYDLELTADNTTLYAGGTFLTVNGGTPRHRLAAFTTVDGLATSFDPDIEAGDLLTSGFGPVDIILTSDEATLYAVGYFEEVNVPAVIRSGAAAFDTATGVATAFNPNIDVVLGGPQEAALSSDESTLFIGGWFSTVNGATSRDSVAAFDSSTGVVTGFDPDVDGPVYALALTSDDATLYIGGGFTTVNGATTRNRLAAANVATGVVTTFNPDLNDSVNTLTLSSDETVMHAGGSFEQEGDTRLLGYAAFDFDPSTPTPSPAPTGATSSGSLLTAAQLARLFATSMPEPGSARPSDFGLREGDLVSTYPYGDPDVYIVNEHGYRRLFLNPIIFNFYTHLGGYAAVRTVPLSTRDAFSVSGLFTNCNTNDGRVYALETTGEDTGTLHHVNLTGDQALAQDPDFFKKVFCVNNDEFSWYAMSDVPYTKLSDLPKYSR